MNRAENKKAQLLITTMNDARRNIMQFIYYLTTVRLYIIYMAYSSAH